MGKAKLLVLGADQGLVAAALERVDADGEVIVLDCSAERLALLRAACPDPRLWYEIGSAEVIPLPDGSVDGVVGDVPDGAAAEVARVVRGPARP
jgi:ubiquinone/menaquinone biosynthesis C-methylase UbiE